MCANDLKPHRCREQGRDGNDTGMATPAIERRDGIRDVHAGNAGRGHSIADAIEREPIRGRGDELGARTRGSQCPRTSPTTCVTSVSVPLSRRLCSTMSGNPRRRAYSVALQNHMGDPRALPEVGNEARRDQFAPAAPSVGSSIAEQRDDGDDTIRGRSATGVREDQQLQQMIVDRWCGRLNDEDVTTTNRLMETHRDLPVGESLEMAGTGLRVEFAGDRRCSPSGMPHARCRPH